MTIPLTLKPNEAVTEIIAIHKPNYLQKSSGIHKPKSKIAVIESLTTIC
jgi:hypothetical protein